MKEFQQEVVCSNCDNSFITVGTTENFQITPAKQYALAYDVFSTKDLIGFKADCIYCSYTNNGAHLK